MGHARRLGRAYGSSGMLRVLFVMLASFLVDNCFYRRMDE
jgi:hypothetical protein